MTDDTDPAALEWESPPPHRAQAGKWNAVADALRRHPGEWAKLPGRHHTGLSQAIKNGEQPPFRPKGSFEAAARNIDKTNRGDIYARYIGND